MGLYFGSLSSVHPGVTPLPACLLTVYTIVTDSDREGTGTGSFPSSHVTMRHERPSGRRNSVRTLSCVVNSTRVTDIQSYTPETLLRTVRLRGFDFESFSRRRGLSFIRVWSPISHVVGKEMWTGRKQVNRLCLIYRTRKVTQRFRCCFCNSPVPGIWKSKKNINKTTTISCLGNSGPQYEIKRRNPYLELSVVRVFYLLLWIL